MGPTQRTCEDLGVDLIVRNRFATLSAIVAVDKRSSVPKGHVPIPYRACFFYVRGFLRPAV